MHVCTCVSIYVCVCMCACVCLYVCMCVYVRVNMYASANDRLSRARSLSHTLTHLRAVGICVIRQNVLVFLPEKEGGCGGREVS